MINLTIIARGTEAQTYDIHTPLCAHDGELHADNKQAYEKLYSIITEGSPSQNSNPPPTLTQY